MATYIELRNLMNDSGLRNRVVAAVIIAADGVMNEDGGTANHTNRLTWAISAFESPEAVGKKMLMAVLAANKAADISAIQTATDTAVQANVDAAIDLFAV